MKKEHVILFDEDVSDKINQQIKKDLLPYLGQETAFELLNDYKGEPLVYKAKLTRRGDQLIEKEVEAPDSTCLSWEPSTIILDEGGAMTFDARMIIDQLLEGTVELSDLQYTDRGFDESSMIRVDTLKRSLSKSHWKRTALLER
jgi:hypothetical protein